MAVHRAIEMIVDSILPYKAWFVGMHVFPRIFRHNERFSLPGRPADQVPGTGKSVIGTNASPISEIKHHIQIRDFENLRISAYEPLRILGNLIQYRPVPIALPAHAVL